MSKNKILFVCIFIVGLSTLSNALTYNISGTVRDSSGKAIAEAMIRLGKLGNQGVQIIATTDSIGKFLINATNITSKPINSAVGTDRPFTLENNKLLFHIARQAIVSVNVFGINGKLLTSSRRFVSPGKNSIDLPRFIGGLHIYRVMIEDQQYIFKSMAGALSNSAIAAKKERTSVNLMKTTSVINDVFLVTKDGYYLNRLVLKNSDTSGIVVTLSPWITGTMTDADGNMYRTIRYGSQEWMVENLRTTTYIDGTPLGQWGGLDGGGYCFYHDTTDTAFQRKWGAYYSWYSITKGKLGTDQWRVPSDADWDTLQTFLSRHGYNYNGGITDSNIIAKAMATKTDWGSPQDIPWGTIGYNLATNNSSGFSALPGYYCLHASGSDQFPGHLDLGGSDAYFCTSSLNDSLYSVRVRYLDYNSIYLGKVWFAKGYGYSVRLVRDVK